ncbi:hypothetical protein [Bifidobacterium gallicum]|uniref:Uncharacterized protein n=1 Tax=Bifidobacterium gallicum DSM 20093 = LMG 11596 TaxID=561180 RepID=D1NTF9_9BIFI|nr:hypothetical protein [Bifidobacterium gallicum]EFA23013.1 hypothetical protein BIFGAL_03117 [Bifidobacterium gallicum DSM 20093 = LMG 11596]KFI57675.1 hypothetical protein BGLCM_1365 [Bifidobacterium gallicum DSM 20093 = LMG 11596]
MAQDKPTTEDYGRFREMLAFFTTQADKNADLGRVEQPADDAKELLQVEQANAEFFKHYGIKRELVKYPNEMNYHITFGTDEHFGTPESTYLNVADTRVMLVPSFENGHITGFQSTIVAENGDKPATSRYATVHDLKLDAEGEPDAALKELFDHQEELLATVRELQA